MLCTVHTFDHSKHGTPIDDYDYILCVLLMFLTSVYQRKSKSHITGMKQLRHSPLDDTTAGLVPIDIVIRAIKCHSVQGSYKVSVTVVRPAQASVVWYVSYLLPL